MGVQYNYTEGITHSNSFIVLTFSVKSSRDVSTAPLSPELELERMVLVTASIMQPASHTVPG